MTAKILVVDDEPLLDYVIRQLFRQEIKNRKLEFHFVRTGVQAIEKLASSEELFDLVLTDIRMPEMDGLTLLEHLPNIDRTLKAVVVSAYGDLQNIRTAMNRGAFDFLTKPIDFDDLKITVNKTLEFVQHLREQERQLAAAQEQLRYQAFYDLLTGLPNRNWLLEEMGREINTKALSERLFAVLFLDIDRYQIVKYSLGHTVAEQLLVEMAGRLKSCVQSSDIVSRVGEDSFAIWLVDLADSQEALNTADRIHQALEQPFNLNGNLVFSRISIGVVFNTIGYDQPKDLLRAADLAMHDAQVRGIGSAAVFDFDMQERVVAQLQLEAELQQAIYDQQLHLNYQPIVSMATGQLVGLEALVRWRHPRRGVVSPDEFIPVAERTGLIIGLGKWVMSEAIRCFSGWRQQFPDYEHLSISINLSGLQLFAPDLLPLLDELLLLHSLSGEFLKLEITESVLMENAEAAAKVLEQLKQRKILLSLDDFGTGYSNLVYLQRLPIDTLKIDRSFVTGMEKDNKNLALVEATVNLARSLGLEAIAEGVETKEQQTLLISLGCQYGQGYFFSQPLEPEAVVVLLAASGD